MLTIEELNSKLSTLEPYNEEGFVELIVCRPQDGNREILTEAILTIKEGLEGDNWMSRGSRHTEDGGPHRDMQITLMSSKIISLFTKDKNEWVQAGDQFFVNFDLSRENLKAGQKLEIGSAVIEITDMPHTSCGKFTKRFGKAATSFVSQKNLSHLRLRGVNAKVLKSGRVKTQDKIKKLN